MGNIISANVSEAVEKIPTDTKKIITNDYQKDYQKDYLFLSL